MRESKLSSPVHGEGERPAPARTPDPSIEDEMQPAHPAISEWVDFGGEAERKGADLCRDAAKSMAIVLALLFPGYITFLSLTRGQLGTMMRAVAPLPLVIWALAAGGLLWLLLRWEWKCPHFDGLGIRAEFLKLVEARKRGTYWVAGLMGSGILFAAVVMALA